MYSPEFQAKLRSIPCWWGQNLRTVIADYDHVLDSHAPVLWHISAGFHSYDHANRKKFPLSGCQPGWLVDLESDPITGGMSKVPGPSRAPQYRARCPVHISGAHPGLHRLQSGLLRIMDGLVHAAVL